ncbi:lipoprotein LipO [Paenibacillus montaniterrae]|uniref:Lipoprotein LipO n=1 Tax=Paenibacillus montaniterrae TaxID=429341 RepID=A0A919YSE7_9BACL|nr:extracellular solute-binding protein [Paenibacillus montaniterrae]GIP16466.1 lipoprotein LipO [Paenibacillus montaniterrae]
MNKKSLIKGIMALTATAFLLAGCSGTGNEAVDADNSAGEGNAKRGKITSTVYDRGNIPNGMGTIEDNLWTKWINENGPNDVKFTAVPRWESSQKLNVLFASGSAPDLIFEFGTSIRNTLFDQKQLLPLDELIENHSTVYKAMLEKYPQLKKAGTKSDGKLYEVGRINEVYPLVSLFIRQDWLDELGLDMPKTTEEMIAVAKAFTEQDPDRNGQDDTYGIAAVHFGDTAGIIRYMYNANFVNVDENNELQFGLENMKLATQFRRDLYEAGVMDKDFLTDKDGSKAKQDFLNGKVGIMGWMTNDYTSFSTKELDTLMKNAPEAKLAIVPLPETPVGRYTMVWNNPIQMTAVVNARAKDPEAVIREIDFLANNETGKVFKYGLEGVHYEIGENGCPVTIDEETYKNEVSWNSDYGMLYSRLEDGKCGYTEAFFDENVPSQKEGLRLFKEAREVYMEKIPVGEGITHSEHMPQLPKDLQTKMSNLSTQINDLFTKSIIGGSKYTVEQAMTEVTELWDTQGGKDIEAWYLDWWSKEKENVLVWDDFYEIYEDQQRAFNEQ